MFDLDIFVFFDEVFVLGLGGGVFYGRSAGGGMKVESRGSWMESILSIFERPALWLALRAVCDHPHSELRVEKPFVGVGEAKLLEASLLGASALEPGALATTEKMRHFVCRGEKWRFLRVFDRRVIRQEDLPANRFVAHFVRYGIHVLREAAYGVCQEEGMSEYLPEVLGVIRKLRGCWENLSPSFKNSPLRELPLDDQLLQFEPRYHVILEAYLDMENS